MSDNNNSAPVLPPAGWYPDPQGGGAQRYWDGAQWAAADATPASIAAADTVRRLPKLKWWQWALIVVGVLVVVSIIIGGINGGRDSAQSAAGTTPSGAASAAPTKEAVEEVKMVDVPDMVGSTVAEARALLEAVGLTLTASEAGDDWIVISQQPGAGSHPAEGLELSVTSEAPKPVYTLEQENALGAAKQYLEYSAFSRQGLIDQLSSQYGSGFSVETATWAADTVGADWNAEAIEAAKQYLDFSSFSRQGLFDQLTSQYGGQFTPDEANQALAAVGY